MASKKTKSKAQPKSKTKTKRSEKKKPRKGEATSYTHHFKLIVTPPAGETYEAVCSLQASSESYVDARIAFASQLVNAGGGIIAYKCPVEGDKEEAPLLVLSATNQASVEIDVASDAEAKWLKEDSE